MSVRRYRDKHRESIGRESRGDLLRQRCSNGEVIFISPSICIFVMNSTVFMNVFYSYLTIFENLFKYVKIRLNMMMFILIRVSGGMVLFNSFLATRCLLASKCNLTWAVPLKFGHSLVSKNRCVWRLWKYKILKIVWICSSIN
jgi:hypothetical protein